MFFLHFKLTPNNIFIVIRNHMGTDLIYMSAGIAGFKGPARSTDFAAEQAGMRLGMKLRKKKIKEVVFLLRKRVEKRVRAVLKALYKFRIRVKKILVIPQIAHNGVRKRKRKRR